MQHDYIILLLLYYTPPPPLHPSVLVFYSHIIILCTHVRPLKYNILSWFCRKFVRDRYFASTKRRTIMLDTLEWNNIITDESRYAVVHFILCEESSRKTLCSSPHSRVMRIMWYYADDEICVIGHESVVALEIMKESHRVIGKKKCLLFGVNEIDGISSICNKPGSLSASYV